MREFDRPGRSAVFAGEAMVATSQPLASSAAIEILKAGGNAVDAAIAASAVLCVVEPQSTGLGGDCFAIIQEPDGSIHGLNGSGRAPAAANLDYYLEHDIKVLWDHPEHSVTAPGAVNAWEMLRTKFGTMGFDQLFRHAIDYGKNGFPISPRVYSDWSGLEGLLSANEAAMQHFLACGHAPRIGSMHKLPAMAATLQTIADKGAGAFYRGEIAEEMAATVQALGGFLSVEDLAAVEGDWVTPISVNYKGYDIHEIPPNGQGITALVLLKLLDRLKSNSLDANSQERVHLEIEAARIAYGVRDAYVSDPASMGRSVDDILADDHIGRLAGLYSADKRNNDLILPELPKADTIYLTVVDRDQRAVSFINSVYAGFGSGIVTPKGGFALQNRGACFVVEEGHDNAIGPSKRPMHTIIPGMATKDGKAEYAFGVMGGAYQPMGHGHVIPNLIDYGMDPQEALDHPRVFWGDDDVMETEAGCPAGLNQFLEQKGHPVRNAPSPHGGGQIIRIDHEAGVLIGGSDPRKDGQAQGY